MPEQTEAPRYAINSLTDFASVPPERLSACLSDFAVAVGMWRQACQVVDQAGVAVAGQPVFANMQMPSFTWTDDGLPIAEMNMTLVDGETEHKFTTQFDLDSPSPREALPEWMERIIAHAKDLIDDPYILGREKNTYAAVVYLADLLSHREREIEKQKVELKARADMIGDICGPLQEYCQKYKVGLGGESVSRLILEDAERMRTEVASLTTDKEGLEQELSAAQEDSKRWDTIAEKKISVQYWRGDQENWDGWYCVNENHQDLTKEHSSPREAVDAFLFLPHSSAEGQHA